MYVDGRTPVNCVMTARIRGSLSPEDLRLALDKVQTRHPGCVQSLTRVMANQKLLFVNNPERLIDTVRRHDPDVLLVSAEFLQD
jgi:hypothetical protein